MFSPKDLLALPPAQREVINHAYGLACNYHTRARARVPAMLTLPDWLAWEFYALVAVEHRVLWFEAFYDMLTYCIAQAPAPARAPKPRKN